MSNPQDERSGASNNPPGTHLKLYLVAFEDRDNEDNYDLLVWAPTAHFAVLIWREWAVTRALALGLTVEESLLVAGNGPNYVFRVPHVPPENIPGAGIHLEWGLVPGAPVGSPHVENIPPEEWR